MTGVQSEVRPASSIFTSHSLQRLERGPSRVNYHPGTGNSYSSYPVIISRSSHKEAASPFHQSSSPSQVWDPRDAQKSYNEEKVPRNDPPKVAEDKTVWQPSDSSLLSSQTGRYWSTSLPTSRGHYSGNKETNELVAARAWSTSSGIQSRKFRGFASQTAPHAPSISNSLDASVIKSNPSPEKLASSITDFSQGLHSASSGETPRHKKLQSYLFKDSQASFGGHETVNTVAGDGPTAFSTTPHNQRHSDAQVYGRFSSNFKQSQREPIKQVQPLSNNANPLYHNTNVAQHGAQTDSFTKYQHTTAGTLAQISEHPGPGRDDTMESFLPIPHADLQGNYATGSETSVVNSLVNTTTRGLMHAYKPGRTIKSIYGFRGFKNPTWGAVKEPSVLYSTGSNERTKSLRYGSDKGKFKVANLYPSLSQKYRFGQREAPTMTSTPAKLERTPTDYSSASPGTLDIVQTWTTPRPVTSGFKEARPLIPESDAGMDSNPDRRQFRIYRRLYGLKGFGTRPLEGAKTSVLEPDKSARVQHGFEGFKPTSSQIWQPKSSRIHGWYNKMGETELGSSHVSTVSQNEQSSEDLEPLLKTAGSTESDTRFTPVKYKNSRKIYSSPGFQPVQNRLGNSNNKTHWKYKEQNPTTASASHRISSAYFRLAEDFRVESSPKSDPRTPSKTKPVAMEASLLNSSTSSMVRGKRVKGKHTNGKKLNESTFLTNDTAIVRLPKRPAAVKVVTYADILGSASFSGVRATTQTPITTHDKDYSLTTTTKQREGQGHRTPPDWRSVEENKFGVGSEEDDVDMKTSDLNLDYEGSGSGFNMSDAFDTTKSKGLGEDSLELDYLRISTGNVSFKSMKLSHTEK